MLPGVPSVLLVGIRSYHGKDAVEYRVRSEKSPCRS